MLIPIGDANERRSGSARQRIVAGVLLLILNLPAGFSSALAQGLQLAPDAVSTAVSASLPKAPIAKIKRKVFTEHGRQRVDDYYWLRERDNPEVTAYLEAENAYAGARLASVKPLIDEIRAELTSRAKATDLNPPFFDNGYYYQRRFREGSEYQVIVRHRATLEAPGEVVLDIPALAAKHAQFHLGRWAASPDNRLVAYGVDFSGDGSHRIFVRNIATGRVVDDDIKDVDANFVFAADSKTLFYTLGNQVRRHTIGKKVATDILIYEERDDTYEVSLSRSKSHEFILLAIEGEQTSEVRYLPADKPLSTFKVIERRRSGVRYDVDHLGGRFFIRTNLAAPDFRIVTAPQSAPKAQNWKELIGETPGRFLSNMEVFDRFIVIDEEHDAIKSMRVFRLADMKEIPVPRSAELAVTAVATEALIAQGYADPRNVFAYGASAGGLLMGAVANLRPDLYAGIVAEVPFVDVITTMPDLTPTWRRTPIRRCS